MHETGLLTPKQEGFCVHYTTIGAETFSNGTKSAIAAGYSENSAYSQASALLKNPKIQQRVKELHAENMSRNNITVDKVLADLEHDKLMARRAGQFAVAKECSIAQGKYLAMFVDRHLTEDADKIREFTERERKEAKRIARILLMQKEA
ncbi:MAG: terminase small subunit [Phycisphaerae bacterium]|nr:terminase small subunit [Phycisphaerae bacterium]